MPKAGQATPFPWHPILTPPLPDGWPPTAEGSLAYYAYATRFVPGSMDCEQVAATSGRIEQDAAGLLHFEALRPELRVAGIQGVRPADAQEVAIFDAVRAAGGIESLLPRAALDPNAAHLAKRFYGQWRSANSFAAEVLRHHPALRAALEV